MRTDVNTYVDAGVNKGSGLYLNVEGKNKKH